MAESIEILLRIRDEANKAVEKLDRGLEALADTTRRIDGRGLGKVERGAEKASEEVDELGRDVNAVNDATRKIDGSGLKDVEQEAARADREVDELAEGLNRVNTAEDGVEHNNVDGLGNSADRAEDDVADLNRRLDDIDRRTRREYPNPFTRVNRGAERAANGIERLNGRLSSLSRLFLTGIGIATVARGLAGLVRASGDFEQALTAVGKTSDIQGQALADLGDRFTELSERMPVATSEILAIGESAGQLGVEGADNILTFTETIAKLTRTSNLAGQDAAQSIARIFNITGEAISDVERFGSALTELGNDAAASESEITYMVTNLAQAIGVFGLTSSQLAGLGTALVETGQRAERSRTSLQRLFQTAQQAVNDSTEELDEFARVAGVSTEEFTKAFREDSLSAIQLFLNGLQRVTQQGETFSGVISGLGISSQEAISVIQTLAVNSEQLEERISQSNAAFEENVALNREFAQFAGTFNSKLQTFINKAGTVARIVGDEIIPTISKLIDDTTTLAENGQELNVFVQVGNAIATSIEAVRIGISSFMQLFNAATINIKQFLLTFSEGLRVIAEGLSSITFGSVSDYFESEAKSIAKTSAELRKSIATDYADIERYQNNQVDAFERIAGIYDDQAEAISKAAHEQAEAAKNAQDEFAEVSRHFRTEVGKNFALLALNAQTTTDEIKAAFEKDLGAAENTRQVKELELGLQLAGNKGVLAADEIEGALEKTTAKTKELTDALDEAADTNNIEQSFERLGQRSTQALASLEASALTDFKAIAESGTQSADAIFRAYEGALKKTTTLEGLENLKEALENAPARGIKQVDGYNRLLEQTSQKIAEARGQQESFTQQTDQAASAQQRVTQAVTQTAQATASASQQAAQHSQQVSSFASSLGDAFGKALNHLGSLSENTLAYFGSLQRQRPFHGAETGAERLRSSLEVLEGQLARSSRAMRTLQGAGIDQFNQNSLRAEIAFKKQSLAVQEYTQKLQNANSAAGGAARGLGNLVREAQRAADNAFALDSQQLTGLRSSIQAARQQMQGLRDDASSTLSSLRDELDQIDGNYERIARRQAAQRRASIQGQLAEAQGVGDQTAINRLQKALGVLDQIENRRVAEARDRRQQEIRQREEAQQREREQAARERQRAEEERKQAEQDRQNAIRQRADELLQAREEPSREEYTRQKRDEYLTANAREASDITDNVLQAAIDYAEKKAVRKYGRPQPEATPTPAANEAVRPAAQTQTQEPRKEITVNLRAPNGRTVRTRVDDESEADKLLGLLEDAGFTAS